MMKKALMAVALFSALPVTGGGLQREDAVPGRGERSGGGQQRGEGDAHPGGPGAVPDGEQRSAAGDAGYP